MTPPPGTTTPPPGTTPPAGVANYHPSNNGTVYAFSGSALTTYTRPNQYPSPEPTQTTLVGVAQSVTVTNPAAFNGNAVAIDYKTSETTTEMAPVSGIVARSTLDSYYAYTGTPYQGDFRYLGFSSVDAAQNTVTATYGSAGALADELPEAAGQSWQNVPTASISTVIPNNESEQQAIAANGSYVTTITYQAGVMPQMGSNVAKVTSNVDGSGTYMTPRLGTNRYNNYLYQVTAPTADTSSGTITETTTIPPAAPSPNATPAAAATSTATFANWMPSGFINSNLSTETDADKGSVTIPAGCAVPASFGTTANDVSQTKERVDPMLGQLETTMTTNYVVGNIGPVCVTIDDVLTYYYDFTGQNGVGYFGAVPQQVTELQETLHLSSETLASTQRTGGQRFADARTLATNVRVASARLVSARAIERGRFLQSIALGRHFDARAAFRGGSI